MKIILYISKTFIICLTNLKLTNYFLSLSEYSKAKKYLIRSLSKMNFNKGNLADKFKIKVKIDNYDKNMFLYLKKYILNFPSFNLANYPNLDINFDFQNDFDFDFQNLEQTDNSKISDNYISNDLEESKYSELRNYINNYPKSSEQTNISKLSNILISNNQEKIYSFLEKVDYLIDFNNKCDLFENKKEFLFDIGQLFTFAIKNNRHKNILVTQIDDIIEVMNSILNSHNYLILFGRILLKPKSNLKENKYPLIKDIDKEFYDGFDLDVF